MRSSLGIPDLADVGARKLKIRRHDACVTCGDALAAGTTAWWDPEARTIACTACWDSEHMSPAPAEAPLQLGDPGASLMREHERRRRNREQRTREAHPRIGGLLLALQGAPQHESAFHQGALAERAVADSLAIRTDSDRIITLHNRRMPTGRGDIDHLAIAPTGVWVIDKKDWKGKVEISAPWFGTPELLIRGRDLHQTRRRPRATNRRCPRRTRQRRLSGDHGSRRSVLHESRPPIPQDRRLPRPSPPAPQGARQAAQRRRSLSAASIQPTRTTPRNTASSGTLNAKRVGPGSSENEARSHDEIDMRLCCVREPPDRSDRLPVAR